MSDADMPFRELDWSRVNRVADSVELAEIRAKWCLASMLDDPRMLADDWADQAFFSWQASLVDSGDGNREFAVVVEFLLRHFDDWDARDDGDEALGFRSEEPNVEVACDFVCRYRSVEDAIYDKEDIEHFAATEAVRSAWPYWHEFARSTLTRLAAPSLPDFGPPPRPHWGEQSGSKQSGGLGQAELTEVAVALSVRPNQILTVAPGGGFALVIFLRESSSVQDLASGNQIGLELSAGLLRREEDGFLAEIGRSVFPDQQVALAIWRDAFRDPTNFDRLLRLAFAALREPDAEVTAQHGRRREEITAEERAAVVSSIGADPDLVYDVVRESGVFTAIYWTEPPDPEDANAPTNVTMLNRDDWGELGEISTMVGPLSAVKELMDRTFGPESTADSG